MIWFRPANAVAAFCLILFSMTAVCGQGLWRFGNAEAYIREVYRKPTKKELETVRVDEQLRTKYQEFLKQPHTGLFAFLPDSGCYENQETVSASDKCAEVTMPGYGTAYSFRTGNYRSRRFADLALSGNKFIASGIFAHGIIVKLGDMPVDNVNADTPGMSYIVNFKPVTDLAAAKDVGAMLTKGIIKDGYSYGQTTPIVENATYAIRSVAYRGKTFRTIKGVVINEVEFDKRVDIIVVFKVVHRAADGRLTILWKEISRVQSPKIKDSKS